ncbi:GTP cyclohydrolase II, partial [Gonapodya sp. JEL0774]
MTPLYLALLAEDPEKYGFTLTQLRDWAKNLSVSIAGYLNTQTASNQGAPEHAAKKIGGSKDELDSEGAAGSGAGSSLVAVGNGRVLSTGSLTSNHQDEDHDTDGYHQAASGGPDGTADGPAGPRVPVISSRFSSTPAAAAAASLRALSLISDMGDLSMAGGVPTGILTPANPALPPMSALPFHLHPSAQSISHIPVPPYDPVKLVTPSPPSELYMECAIRCRIPTDDKGQFWVHLYVNNRDQEHHLALVYGNLRSRTLDLPRLAETEFDRISRGACPIDQFPAVQAAWAASDSNNTANSETQADDSNVPLARIHSACFTGETICSSRCDCAEQLHSSMQAMRDATRDPNSAAGVILYLRQEGRGIGLPNKLRAYNLQDLGHDTVTANLLLDLPEDGRRYDLAAAMLKDLGVKSVRLMTNNPAKIKGIEEGGVKVVERQSMVPERWKRMMGLLSTSSSPAPDTSTTVGCGGELKEVSPQVATPSSNRRPSLVSAALIESTAEQSESPFAGRVAETLDRAGH